MPGFGTSLLAAMPKYIAQVIGGRKNEEPRRSTPEESASTANGR
jgi:hypothetical protein